MLSRISLSKLKRFYEIEISVKILKDIIKGRHNLLVINAASLEQIAFMGCLYWSVCVGEKWNDNFVRKLLNLDILPVDTENEWSFPGNRVHEWTKANYV